jgi:hypothetical protein
MRRAAATVARLARDASRHASASVSVEFRRPPARAIAPSHPSRGFASDDAPSSDPSSPASPSARSASSASSSARVAFASGLSKRESLAEAVVEAVAEVKAGLGHDVQPTWVQLMVSGDYEDASLAPAFALECFTAAAAAAPASSSSAADSDSRGPPALFGGVVTGCVGGRGQCMDGPCVSVTAAKMPGVRAIPFRVDDASLPPQVDWAAAMRDAAGDADADARRAPSDGKPERKTEKENSKKPKNGLALLVFADADFVEVDDLARRVHALLPDAIVVGGVAAPGGALFLGGGGFESGGGGGFGFVARRLSGSRLGRGGVRDALAVRSRLLET